VGYATIDESKVRRIAELSSLSELVREGARLWPQANR
jgi:hypothetical protein